MPLTVMDVQCIRRTTLDSSSIWFGSFFSFCLIHATRCFQAMSFAALASCISDSVFTVQFSYAVLRFVLDVKAFAKCFLAYYDSTIK